MNQSPWVSQAKRSVKGALRPAWHRVRPRVRQAAGVEQLELRVAALEAKVQEAELFVQLASALLRDAVVAPSGRGVSEAFAAVPVDRRHSMGHR